MQEHAQESVHPKPISQPFPGNATDLLQRFCDWENSPIPHVLAKLGELKRAYDTVAAIVVTRQESQPRRLSCWAWDNRRTGYNGGPIPESVLSGCSKIIPDGKWLFRDDGHFVERKGVRLREPVLCCSVRCTDMYNRWRNDQKQKAKGAATASDSGIEVR